MKINETYTGADATLEILIMLLVAFLLGWMLRLLYDKYLFEYIDEESNSPQENIAEPQEKEIEEKDIKVEDDILKNEDDDLKLIEGIGPKIEALLKSADIKTFEILSNVSPEQIRDILKEKGGERYAFHDPATWPDQAKLVFEDRMDELKEYQDFLSGGKA